MPDNDSTSSTSSKLILFYGRVKGSAGTSAGRLVAAIDEYINSLCNEDLASYNEGYPDGDRMMFLHQLKSRGRASSLHDLDKYLDKIGGKSATGKSLTCLPITSLGPDELPEVVAIMRATASHIQNLSQELNEHRWNGVDLSRDCFERTTYLDGRVSSMLYGAITNALHETCLTATETIRSSVSRRRAMLEGVPPLEDGSREEIKRSRIILMKYRMERLQHRIDSAEAAISAINKSHLRTLINDNTFKLGLMRKWAENAIGDQITSTIENLTAELEKATQLVKERDRKLRESESNLSAAQDALESLCQELRIDEMSLRALSCATIRNPRQFSEEVQRLIDSGAEATRESVERRTEGRKKVSFADDPSYSA